MGTNNQNTILTTSFSSLRFDASASFLGGGLSPMTGIHTALKRRIGPRKPPVNPSIKRYVAVSSYQKTPSGLFVNLLQIISFINKHMSTIYQMTSGNLSLGCHLPKHIPLEPGAKSRYASPRILQPWSPSSRAWFGGEDDVFRVKLLSNFL